MALTERRIDVAIVGGGPAGAAVAVGLARRGIESAVFERTDEPRWRACGVYSSPLTRTRLASLGLEPGLLAGLVREVPGLNIESASAAGTASARLGYEGLGGACGIDRVRLDAELLRLAEAAGATVIRHATVRAVVPARGPNAVELGVSTPGGPARWSARLVVGADGPGSMVARAFGVQLRAQWLRRAGVTFHLRVATPARTDARMVIGRGWYAGLCPVPGDRLNVGIVIGERALRNQLHSGQRLEQLARGVLRAVPTDGPALAAGKIDDRVCVALPLLNRVRRLAGPGFVLVGDACGFLDPISGEGLHRAFVSAERASDAIANVLTDPHSTSLADYDRYLRRRFGRKDLVSWVLQGFLGRPELLTYAVRRLEGRPDLRETFSAVLADRVPPERVLDPGYLVRLLRP